MNIIRNSVKGAAVLFGAALVMAGCQRDGLADGVDSGDGQIRYSVSVAGSTKGALINTSGDDDQPLPAGSSFFVSAYKGSEAQFENKKATSKDGGVWTNDDPQYWPLSTELAFFAYANTSAENIAMNAECTAQTLTYAVPADASAHQDILLGYGYGDGGNKGIAELRFSHPLTAVLFKEGTVSGDIKSITLSGLISGGTVTMTSDGIGDWTVGETEKYETVVTLSGGEDPLEVGETSKLIGEDSEGHYTGAFLLVPQKLAASDGHPVTVTVVLATAGGDPVTVSADIASGSWKAGKTNTYTLSYGSKTGYALTVTEWDSETYPVELEEEQQDLLPGKFSVNATEYVQFSRGNLYCTRTGTADNYTYSFDFEEKQYDYRTRPGGYPKAKDGITGISTEDNMSGMFQWNKECTAGSDFGAFSNIKNISGATSDTFDWGAAVGGNWSTLSITEWAYLINTRSGNRYARATVNGIVGIILFPDGWTNTHGITINGINDGGNTYKTQSITLTNWKLLEADGAVFLPAAGTWSWVTEGTPRWGMIGNQLYGDYWSSNADASNANYAQYLTFNNSTTPYSHYRECGKSVRLVQRFNKPVEYVEIAAKYDGVNVTTLKWSKQNLSITASGKKSWKGGNSTAVKVPGTDEDVINGDFFQWPAYAGYCGKAADADKGLLVYTSFTSKMCGDGSDAFAFKSDKKFQEANTPYYVSGYEKYAEVSHLTIDRTGAYTGHNDDVANIILGGNWRMPTCAEFNRMIEATYWAWDATDKGYYVFIPDASHAANTRVNSIGDLKKKNALLFFPAIGDGCDGNLNTAGSYCYYWSTDVYVSDYTKAYCMGFSDVFRQTDFLGRSYGFAVRPVSD